MRAVSLTAVAGAVATASLLGACSYMPKFDMPFSDAPPTPLTQTVLFDTGSSALKATEVTALTEFVNQLQCKDGYNVVIEGHTDNIGADGYNVALSEKRSMAVRDVLTSSGVAADKVAVAGFGETVPVAPNDDKSGRAQNRRVNVIATQAEGGCGGAEPAMAAPEGSEDVPKYLYRMGEEGNG